MHAAAPRTLSPSVAPSWPVLQAPADWRHLDFISDLHLQASEPATFGAWKDYMQTTPADAVFVLGDLFEVWIGDDVVTSATTGPDQVPGFEARCAQVLHAASQRLAIFFMHGNRDFLLGATFARKCGMTLLDDPTVLDFAGQRWLLSHGDALCLDDTDYMKFRAEVRSVPWQQEFLAQPLAKRQEVARGLRIQSEARKRSGTTYADLDEPSVCAWLRAAHARTLIHGHTHKPADHTLPHGLRRITLSDWDAAAKPPRTEILRLSATAPDQGTASHQGDPGGTLQRLAAHQIRV